MDHGKLFSTPGNPSVFLLGSDPEQLQNIHIHALASDRLGSKSSSLLTV